jgi:hypothetical protein
MIMAIPINRPMKQRVLTADASSGSSVKNERTIPNIPVKKMRMTPQPTAAFIAPKGAFFNGIVNIALNQDIDRLFYPPSIFKI